MSLVQLKQVSKNYQMGELSVQALKNIELETDKQSFVSFVGPSGSDDTEYGSKQIQKENRDLDAVLFLT